MAVKVAFAVMIVGCNISKQHFLSAAAVENQFAKPGE